VAAVDLDRESQTTDVQPRPRLRAWLDRLTAGVNRHLRVIRWSILVFVALSAAFFAYFYVKYARRIDRQLAAGAFPGALNIYAAPRTVAVGDPAKPEQIVAELRLGGYGPSPNHPAGWYAGNSRRIEIHPGPNSYFDQWPAVLTFTGGKIARIQSLPDGGDLAQYQLEPQLIANLAHESRERRRLVRFRDIPQPLVDAVVSVEDKRFFLHSGFDPVRILKAAYIDLREGRKEQGASTLSMQLARSLWLTSDKRFRRKLEELLIALHLETRLSKQEIFEYYSNQIYLGRRGTFNIHGFGEASRAFFGKDIRRLTLAEAALLAGIIQRPSYYDPFRHPERAIERRNLVLRLMQENGYITAPERQAASAAPLKLFDGYSESLDAQYFVDLLHEELSERLGEETVSGSVYTSLDLRLQAAAEQAIRAGMQTVDRLTRRKGARAEVALVALDPSTGEIKALAGGRDYARSQLNRVLARRQPGSVFKPFVFAAALGSAVAGGGTLLTPATTVIDEPTQWVFNRQVYEPKNYGGAFHGAVTLRRALVKSLNIPTIKVAEMTGYDKVVNVARRAGFSGMQPTPAIAVGAYEATPLEVAGAFTVFANNGWYVRPSLTRSVRAADGLAAYTHTPEKRQALDPRVAFLVTDMMEDVIRRGTAARARATGFVEPAAGKTGTSRDGWFAGFTTELLCVVWVGFDDNRELGLEGSKSALPIWTEFMKRAHRIKGYDEPRKFQPPAGVVRVAVDPGTGRLAGPFCEISMEYFIGGTQPAAQCNHYVPPPEPEVFGVADRTAEDAPEADPIAPAPASVAPSPAAAPPRAPLPAVPGAAGEPEGGISTAP
jgi:penicillin-binding protein 1B